MSGADPKTLNPFTRSLQAPQRLSANRLRLGRLEPRAGIDWLAAPADLEVQLGPVAAAAVARRGDGIAGGHALTHRLVEPLIMTVEAHVPVPVIDDGQETEPRQPVRVDDPALVNRPDRRPTLGGDEQAVPFQAAGPRFAEARHDPAAHRPGELPAQVRKGVVAVDRELLRCPAQLAQQPLQARLLAAQPLQALRP